jgi:hypothetical protein
MTTPDLNQLTVSGCVERGLQLHQHPDSGTVCRFVLTHTVDTPTTSASRPRSSSTTPPSTAPLGESFAAVYSRPEDHHRGRLDCEHQQTFTGYQPIASILADSSVTMHQLAKDSSTSDALPA